MSQQIDGTNFIEAKYDVFQKFHRQLAVLASGDIHDFRCMTIGWGMMGNVWGHPGSALTVYVHPSRHTFEYTQKNEFFTVSFFPEEYHKDVITLGTHSSRNEDKIALTSLTSKAIENGVGFEQAELTFVCRKIYAEQFDIQRVPDFMKEGIYNKLEPHYMYIGSVVDAFGMIE